MTSPFTKTSSELAREIGRAGVSPGGELGKASELGPGGRDGGECCAPEVDLAETAGDEGWDAHALMDVADASLASSELATAGALGVQESVAGWSVFDLWPGGECEAYTHTWDPASFNGVGDPVADAECWRLQDGPSCAVNAQLCIIESLTGECIDQAEVCDWLEDRGWYSPWSGTPTEHLDKVLVHQGLETETMVQADVMDIVDALERGDGVLVALNAQEIWAPLRDANTGEVVSQPGPYGHAVQITGVDQHADGSFSVIMNDTGTPDGAMRAVALEDFLESWADYDNTMVLAKGERPTLT